MTKILISIIGSFLIVYLIAKVINNYMQEIVGKIIKLNEDYTSKRQEVTLDAIDKIHQEYKSVIDEIHKDYHKDIKEYQRVIAKYEVLLGIKTAMTEK